MQFFLIVKDPRTEFMRHFGVFEKEKFIGQCHEARTESVLPPKELLDKCIKKNIKCFIIGIIVPNVGSIIKDGYKIMSDGEKFCLLEDLFKLHNAPAL